MAKSKEVTLNTIYKKLKDIENDISSLAMKFDILHSKVDLYINSSEEEDPLSESELEALAAKLKREMAFAEASRKLKS